MKEFSLDELHFIEGNHNESKQLILDFHYSKRLPAAPIYVGNFLHSNTKKYLATCYFSRVSAQEWGKFPILELTRLVRTEDGYIPLTSLISKCIKQIRQLSIDLLVSYADSTQRHHGGIYQACSWNYYCKRKPRADGIILNGKFIPNRTCNSIYGTSGVSKLKELLGNFELHYDLGKHLYWKPLNKNGKKLAKQLKLECNAYPKDDEAICSLEKIKI